MIDGPSYNSLKTLGFTQKAKYLTPNDKDDNSRAWTLSWAEMFVLEDCDGRNPWKYVYAGLLDDYCA